MSKIINYTVLEQELVKITHLSNIASVINWDAATGLPKGSAENRHQEMATLTSVIHEMFTSPNLGELIEKASNEKENLDDWQKANLEIIKKSYLSQTCISSEDQHEYSMASSECELVWRQARSDNDFKMMQSHQDRVFNIIRKIAKLKSAKLAKSPLDILIDSYDPDRTSAEIDICFNKLKIELPKLITQIVEKQKSQKIIPLSKPIDEETQKRIGLKMIEKMGFSLDHGRLDKSIHPFCSGSNDDVRLTTRYNVNNFLSSLFGVIHETGHGLYQQHLPAKYRNQPVGNYKGLAIHESQSLIMEMQAGTSRSFITYLAKLLRDEFSFSGAEYSEDNLYKLVTTVKPSFIRVDADEVTYPLHVIMRYEIEKEIIDNNLQAKDLPSLWNQKMQEYLGIVPDTDTIGCMQDIHWPSGTIGYFPSYTNGAIIASMLMKKAKSEYKSIDSELGVGNFSSINKYLNENLRQFGSLKTSHELLNTATGYSEIQPEIFLDYLKEKYL